MTTHLDTRPCASRTAISTTPTATADERVGDAERLRTSHLLGRAFTSGHLDVVEYEQRLDALATTRTHRELATLTDDLPVAALLRSDPERLAHRRRVARLALAIHVTAAALAVVLCWAVWLVVALTADVWYPWPVWPLLGAAAGVLPHALATLSLTRQPSAG